MSSNTNIGNTPVNQGYVQLIHTGETGGIDGTLRTLYDGDGTASDLQIASNAVKISTQLYIGSKTITEYVQDVVGDMFTTGSYTNITTTYDDTNGNIDLNATGAVSGITGGTGIDATGSGNITIAIDSTVATKTYVDNEVAGLVDSAPGTLDTLNELAAALGDDPNFATTTATNIATKLAKASNLSDLTNAATARTNLGVDPAGTDNSTDVTLAGSLDYITISGQTITRNAIDLTTDVTGVLPVGNIDSSVVTLTGTQTLSNKTLTSPIIDSVTISTITTSAESFTNNDTSLMTSAAIDDLIISKGYGFGDGDITEVSAGNGLSGGGLSGSVSLAFDGSELADMTENMVSTDEFVVLDGTTSKRKAISEIRLTDFDDTGFTSGISFNGSTANGLLTYGNSTTADVESNLTFDGNTLTTDALIIDGGGTYAAGSIYSDSNWGMLFRAKQASPGQAEFRWANSADSELMRIDSSGNVIMQPTSKLYFDGGSDTYISETSADTLKIFVGGSNLLELGEGVTDYVRVLDNTYLGAGSSLDMYMRHDGTNSFLENGTGNLTIRNLTDDGDIILQSDNGAGGVAPYITLDGSATRTNVSKDLRLDNSVNLQLGSGGDMSMSHDGSNATFSNAIGNLIIQTSTDDGDVIFRCDDGLGGVTPYITLDGSTTDLILSAPRGIKAGPNGGNTTNVFEIDTSGSTQHGLMINADQARAAGRYALYVDDEDPNSRGSVVIQTASGPSLTTTGSVGIGVTSPSSKLHINGSSNGAGIVTSISNTYYAAASTDEYVQYQGEFYQNDVAALRAGGYIRIGKSGDFSNNANASGHLVFATRNAGTLAEKMRIDSSGNVGIGVIPKTGGSTWQHIQFGGTGNLIARTSDTTIDSMFANNYYINSSNVDSYITTGAAARMFFNDNVITFDQAASGSTDAAVSFSTALKIDALGDVKITESLGIGVNASSTTGRLDCSNDVVAFSTSDKRLKENIKPLDSALDKVLQISGVEFDWKELTEEEKKTIHGNQGHDVGVIAQEIEEVLPEVVTTRDSGYKAVKYEKIVPLLIEAIKEQQKQIEELKNG